MMMMMMMVMMMVMMMTMTMTMMIWSTIINRELNYVLSPPNSV
jgi:hypothetical protein